MNILLMVYKNRKEDDKIIYYYLYIYRERDSGAFSLIFKRDLFQGRLDRFVDSQLEIFPENLSLRHRANLSGCRWADGKSIVQRNNTDRFGESQRANDA